MRNVIQGAISYAIGCLIALALFRFFGAYLALGLVAVGTVCGLIGYAIGRWDGEE